ncbi:AMMECR1 domain-containing protein [Sulfurimonas sp. SAG-AH-194-C20]|nr:AMMECR1 domain-containing protein [Sulfurimonas sp. SAG-AH-194-C20]MDF1878192.1 AMMECR1 domain-containing protein [Sulfurimonas sp. SAG-AH-194-C20]
MSRSVLLQLARDSIEEVFHAQRSIDKNALLQEHPLLNEKISTTINLFINKELKGSFTSNNVQNSLLSNIILCAKKAAFESKPTQTLKTSEYPHCDIELLLDTPDGQLSEIDPAILQLR